MEMIKKFYQVLLIILGTFVLSYLISSFKILKADPVTFNNGGVSHLLWPFPNTNNANRKDPDLDPNLNLLWAETDGSDHHNGADDYAQDWNLGTKDEGKDFFAPFDGIVLNAYMSKTGYGNTVVIKSNSASYAFRIAHLGNIFVSKGQQVIGGKTSLGSIGNTGYSTGAHAHIALYRDVNDAEVTYLSRPPSNDGSYGIEWDTSAGASNTHAAQFDFSALPTVAVTPTPPTSSIVNQNFSNWFPWYYKVRPSDLNNITEVLLDGRVIYTSALHCNPQLWIGAGNHNFKITYQGSNVPNVSIDSFPFALEACGADGAPPPSGTSNPNQNVSDNNAKFISDVTIPDGTTMPGNASFVKTWALQNTGNTTWNNTYKLVFQSGQSLGQSSVNVSSNISPGQTTNISVNLTAPNTIGSYRSYWKMQNASGDFFGDTVWVDIKVQSGSSLPSSSGQVKLFSSANYQNQIGAYSIGSNNDPNGNAYSIQVPSGWSAITYRCDNSTCESRCWTSSIANFQDYSWQAAIQSIKVFNYNACDGGQTVKLYSSANYGGSNLGEFSTGTTDTPNHTATSMSIPSGWSVITYDQDGLRGRNKCWSSSQANLQNTENWQLAIESMDIRANNVCPQNGNWVKICRVTGNYADHPDQCMTVTENISDLNSFGFGNDILKSISVEGGWDAILFEDNDYAGRRYQTGTSTDLNSSPFGYGASSIQVKRRDPAAFILYKAGDYNDGGPFYSDRSITNLEFWNADQGSWNDKAQSMKVGSGYEVIGCSDAYFHGFCGRTKLDMSDLNSLAQGLRNGLSSIVVCQTQCDPPPTPAILLDPTNNVSFLPGTNILFNWTGNGEEYYIEITGGALTSPITFGWRNQYNFNTVLPASNLPYSWRVKDWNHFGEGGWSTVQTFKVQDIAPIQATISGSLNANINTDISYSVSINPVDASNLTYNWSPSPKSGQGTKSVIYNWTDPISQIISVSVQNTGATVITQKTINLGCADGKYLAEYYNNKNLTGSPGLYSCEEAINNDWQNGGPTQIPSNSFNVGNGSDGALTVATGATEYTDNVRTKISSVTAAGQKVVCTASILGFTTGTPVLIIQSRGTGVGNFEFNTVASVAGGCITMQNNLTNAYDSTYAQVLRIPQYTTVNVAGTLTVHPWDGVTGGVMVFKANGGIKLNGGSINTNGKGFRGGAAITGRGNTGFEGEGITSYVPTNSRAPNSGGGGGGTGSNDGGAGGGGGAYSTNGQTPYDPQYSDPGIGAEAFYVDYNMPQMFFGGGGGSGGTDDSAWDNTKYSGKGGNGGGIMVIETNSIEGSGSLTSSGEKGGNHNVQGESDNGGGGGGAGGSIKLLSDKINLDSITIDYGGSGGGSSPVQNAGYGGAGLGNFTYCVKSGTNAAPGWVLAANCNKDNFSVRWNGNINFATAGSYNFTTQMDDGVKVFLDGSTTALISRWGDGYANNQASQTLTAGNHMVKVEYYDNTSTAKAVLNIAKLVGVTPTLNQIPGQTINNGQTFTTINLNSYVTNLAQQTSLTWSATGNTNISVAIANNIATLTYPGSWTGTENIAFKATNQDAQYATSTAAFVVNTTQASVELLTAPWNLSGNNGASEKYQGISTSVLAGKTTMRITYDLHGLNAIGGDASAIIFDQNGWQYISLANYGQNGKNGPQTIDIALSAFTGLNLTTGSNTVHTRFWYGSAFTVDITSIKLLGPGGTNNPPTISTSAVLTGSENVAYTYDVNATDPENNTLTYSLAQNPTGMTINSSNGIISWTPTYTQSGTTHIKVGVSDGTNTVYQEYDLVIANVNRAPTFTQIPGQTITNGQTFTTINLATYGTDPDGQAITWSYSGNTNITVAIASGIATLTYPGTWTGTNNIVFKATDSSNAFATSTAAFIVNAASACTNYNAEYFNNMTLSGTPALTRCDATVNYDWSSGGPGSPIGIDGFSVRWTYNMNVTTAGDYLFTINADDGDRLYVDGVLKINNWSDHGTSNDTATVTLNAGVHVIKFEYYESGGGAVAKLNIAPVSSSCTPGTNTFCVDYYNNMNVSGTKVYTTTEATINHDWGGGGPGNGVNVDNFSARWLGNFTFTAGNHTFTTVSDDGIRVWVDGVIKIDNWVDHGMMTDNATVNLTAGTHLIKVEFKENGGGALAFLSWN